MQSHVRRPWLLLVLVLVGVLITVRSYNRGVSRAILAESQVAPANPPRELAAKIATDQASANANLVTWHIGSVDPRFGITEKELADCIRKATDLWEAAAGTRLFRQDEKEGFPVNLVFDERQELLLEQRKEKPHLDELAETVRQLKEYRQTTLQRFENANKELEARYKAHETAVRDYNAKVGYWNRTRDASPEVVSELDATKASLQSEAEALESQHDAVAKLRDQDSEAVQAVNRAVDALNSAAAAFNALAKPGAMTQVGVCVRSSKVEKIEVFAFQDFNSLTCTLAHEFGHALGVAHVQKTGALMNPVADAKAGEKELRLTDEDKQALQEALKKDP
ncbi:MAG: matrixin family metalloprotease [Armatimonadetes bacterium]|nr:matrixin family metalloprotease [Armatimonadota bacterium]